MSALTAAASGLKVQETKLATISHNLANSSTPGFKYRVEKIVSQGSLVLQNAGAPTSADGSVNPSGTFIGMGARVAGIVPVMEQGSAEMTDNQFDVMIDGPGFFAVELPNGETAYTRDGSFTLNGDRQLVTSSGYKIKPDLTIPANTTGIDINGEGQIYARVDGQTASTLVGQFELAVFANPAGLDDSIGNNLALETPASNPPTNGHAGAPGFGHIQQYSLESSNVKPVVQLTAMIETQRAYAMNTKTMSAVEQMDQNLQTLMR